MGWKIVSAPGEEYGPCSEACTHPDCLAKAQLAEAVCPLCGERIGYETRFYHNDPIHSQRGLDKVEHAECVWRWMDEGATARKEA